MEETILQATLCRATSRLCAGEVGLRLSSHLWIYTWQYAKLPPFLPGSVFEKNGHIRVCRSIDLKTGRCEFWSFHETHVNLAEKVLGMEVHSPGLLAVKREDYNALNLMDPEKIARESFNALNLACVFDREISCSILSNHLKDEHPEMVENAFLWACRSNAVGCARILLHRVVGTIELNDAMFLACGLDCVEIIHILLDAGVNVDVVNDLVVVQTHALIL